jgi:hypothetical protein
MEIHLGVAARRWRLGGWRAAILAWGFAPLALTYFLAFRNRL